MISSGATVREAHFTARIAGGSKSTAGAWRPTGLFPDAPSIGKSRKISISSDFGCKSFQFFRPTLHDHDLFGDGGILVIPDHQKAAAIGGDIIV